MEIKAADIQANCQVQFVATLFFLFMSLKGAALSVRVASHIAVKRTYKPLHVLVNLIGHFFFSVCGHMEKVSTFFWKFDVMLGLSISKIQVPCQKSAVCQTTECTSVLFLHSKCVVKYSGKMHATTNLNPIF